MTNLHYPQLLAELKLLSLNMFSKVPRGQIKKVKNFTLWFDAHSYGLVFLILACCLMNWKVIAWLKVRSLKWGGKWSEYRCSHSSYSKSKKKQSSGELAKSNYSRVPFLTKLQTDYKRDSNKVLFKKILEDCFFKEFFTYIPEIIGTVRKSFIFQIIGLFLLFMSGF